MEYFSKVVEYFPEVGFRGKRDIFLRISKHTHLTHPRNAKRPSTKALREVCPREILTQVVTQILTIRVESEAHSKSSVVQVTVRFSRAGDQIGECLGEYPGECLLTRIPLFVGLSAWSGEYGEW
jgi:hypothetical protein